MADYSLVKERIRDAIDVVMLLEYYGAKITDRQIKYDKVRSSCPIHGGDGDTNFSFDLNTKLWTCYSRHCGEDMNIPIEKQKARDIFLFIQLCEERRTGKKCSFGEALQIASKIANIPINSESLTITKDVKDKLDIEKWIRQQKRINKKVELDYLDESVVEQYKNNFHPYLLTRNFSEEIIDTFELGYSKDGVDEDYNSRHKDFPGRIIVPIRDDNGNLVGLSGRLATDDKNLINKYKKYKHMLAFNKGYVLYNFNKAKDTIRETNQIIICEGFFDVMRLWSFGVHNAVAVMGTALIPEQLSLIISNCMEAYICMDGDNAGKLGNKRIAEQLLNVSTDAYIIDLPNNSDPDNLGSLDFWMAYSKAKKYIKEFNSNTLTTKNRFAII